MTSDAQITQATMGADARPRRRWWDVIATVLLILIGAMVCISLATLLLFTVAWGSYGASMTGDQSWIATALFLLAVIVAILGGVVWSSVRMARRRIAFWIILAPNVVGIVVLAGFGLASGDITNIFAWLFPLSVFF